MGVNLTSFPFDSQISGYTPEGYPIYDRPASAKELADWMGAFFGDGIFGADGVSVTAAGGMDITVSPVRCLIGGRYGRLENASTLTLEGQSGTAARIDTVVLRMDLGTEVRRIVLDVVKGTAAANPSAPALTRDASQWELGIADVLVRGNASAISQGDITLTVLDSARCGVVAQAMTTLDTSHYFEQITEAMAAFSAQMEAYMAELGAALQQVTQGNLIRRAEHLKTLTASGWTEDGEGFSQTVNVSGCLESTVLCSVQTAPAPDESYERYTAAAIRAVQQGNGYVRFYAAEQPEEDVRVNIVVITGGVGV